MGVLAMPDRDRLGGARETHYASARTRTGSETYLSDEHSAGEFAIAELPPFANEEAWP